MVDKKYYISGEEEFLNVIFDNDKDREEFKRNFTPKKVTYEGLNGALDYIKYESDFNHNAFIELSIYNRDGYKYDFYAEADLYDIGLDEDNCIEMSSRVLKSERTMNQQIKIRFAEALKMIENNIKEYCKNRDEQMLDRFDKTYDELSEEELEILEGESTVNFLLETDEGFRDWFYEE